MPINNYADLATTKTDGDFAVSQTSAFYSVYNNSVNSKAYEGFPAGWKFHVGIDDSLDSEGKQSNLEKGWRIVSDVLSKHNVRTWKVVKPNQNFSEIKHDPQVGEIDQRGKQITIHAYLDPHDEDPSFWQKVMQEIETELRLNNVTPNVPNNDHEITLTGSNYIRYRQDGICRRDVPGFVPSEEEDESDQIALVENRTNNPNPSNLLNPYKGIQLHPPTSEDQETFRLNNRTFGEKIRENVTSAFVSVGQSISNTFSWVSNAIFGGGGDIHDGSRVNVNPNSSVPNQKTHRYSSSVGNPKVQTPNVSQTQHSDKSALTRDGMRQALQDAETAPDRNAAIDDVFNNLSHLDRGNLDKFEELPEREEHDNLEEEEGNRDSSSLQH